MSHRDAPADPKDPRNDPRHRERGPEVLIEVTYPLLSEITGLPVATLRTYAHRGAFNPRDLGSVVTFIAKRKSREG